MIDFPNIADLHPNARSHLQDNLLRELHAFSSKLSLIHIFFFLDLSLLELTLRFKT